MKQSKVKNSSKIILILTNAFVDNKYVIYTLKQQNEKYISSLIKYSPYNEEKFGDVFLNNDEIACSILIDSKKRKPLSLLLLRI